jgi:large subunit ribosomal protein L17
MRHGKTVNHLGRTASHRNAMLSNMAASLILHKRITTTLAKAKALRKYVEPLMTKSKKDNTHSRRVVFSYLQDKEAVKELFSSVADKIAERNGGYTRIMKLGFRKGDNAEIAMIELVDYNEFITVTPKKKTTRRRKPAAATKKATEVVTEQPSAEIPVEDAPNAPEANDAEETNKEA